jgi:Holliday junction resolvasome RuvABC DNA-binding subunit
MATMSVPTTNVRDAVLHALEDRERQPMEILEALGQLGYVDSDIKQALSELIHEGQIELTSQRVLKTPSRPAA